MILVDDSLQILQYPRAPPAFAMDKKRLLIH